MALTERSRSALYQGLSAVVHDEQAVQEMLSFFPARDVEEPATKEFVRAEIAELRVEMADLRNEFRSEFGEFKAEIHTLMRQQLQWMVGLMVTFFTLQITVLAIVK